MTRTLGKLGAVAAAVASVALLAASPAQAAYDCRYGKVCLNTGLGGSGARWEVPSCGEHWLPAGFQYHTHSVQTWGNSVTLIWFDQDGQGGYLHQIGYVGQNGRTNLDAHTADLLNYVRVNC